MKYVKSNFLIGAALLCVLGFVLWPLLRDGFFITDDGDWMIIRLSAFYQSLIEGQFPVRFLGRLNQSYGYPVANFLYPGFLYIGSVIHFLGVSFPNTVKIIFGASVIIAVCAVFVWLRKFFSGIASAVAAAAFAVSPYLLFNLYKRGSIGEVLAIAVASLAILTIESGWRFMFAPLIGLLIVSHNSLALLMGLFITVYVIMRKRYDFFLPLVLGILIATFFWFPALFEQRFVVFRSVTVSDPDQYFITLKNAWLLGPVFFISAVIVLTKNHKKRTVIEYFFLSAFFISLFAALPVSGILWQGIMTSLFQFPYRFLALSLLPGAWLTAYVVSRLEKKAIFVPAIGVLAVIGISSALPQLTRIIFVQRPDGYYTTNEATTTVANEYMPRWVKDIPIHRSYDRIEFYTGRGTIEKRVEKTQKILATVNAEENSVLQINSLYYPGWGVVVDGIPVRIDYSNPRGVMRISVPAGTHTVQAEFRETVLRFIADAVSAGAILIWIIYGVLLTRENRSFDVNSKKFYGLLTQKKSGKPHKRLK